VSPDTRVLAWNVVGLAGVAGFVVGLAGLVGCWWLVPMVGGLCAVALAVLAARQDAAAAAAPSAAPVADTVASAARGGLRAAG